MSLKTEVERTEKLKNDIKLVKSKINEEILSGGGTIINSLSEVPLKIKEMSGSNIKYAEGTCDINIAKKVTNVTLMLNLNYTPKLILLNVINPSGKNNFYIEPKVDDYSIYPNTTLIIEDVIMNKNESISFSGKVLGNGKPVKIEKWIAIG